jgi:hypothetical protein
VVLVRRRPGPFRLNVSCRGKSLSGVAVFVTEKEGLIVVVGRDCRSLRPGGSML